MEQSRWYTQYVYICKYGGQWAVGRMKNSVLNLKCDILDGDDDFSGNNKITE